MRGGKREGAGRKRKSVKSIAIRIPQDIADILAAQESATDYIIMAIRYYETNKHTDSPIVCQNE